MCVWVCVCVHVHVCWLIYNGPLETLILRIVSSDNDFVWFYLTFNLPTPILFKGPSSGNQWEQIVSPSINWSIHKSHIWVFLLNPEHHPGGNSPSGSFFFSPNLESVSVWNQGVSEQMTSWRPTETDVQTLGLWTESRAVYWNGKWLGHAEEISKSGWKDPLSRLALLNRKCPGWTRWQGRPAVGTWNSAQTYSR